MGLKESLALAENRCVNREYQQANVLLAELVSKFPEEARVHHLLGQLSLDTGSAETAVEHFNKALKLDPTMAESHKGLGDIHMAARELDRAQQEYEEAVRLKPDYFEAHANLATVHLIQHEALDAIHHFKEAIKLRVDVAELHDSLGRALSMNGSSNLAKSAHRHAI